MAKKSFNQRNPAFKWVFLFAVVISIPITLYSFNNTPTEIRSNAATTPPKTCSEVKGSCFKYSCPTTGGYFKADATCSPMIDTVCCKNTLDIPIGLDGRAWYCIFGSPPIEHDTAKFLWKAVPNASSYTIFYRPYSSDGRYNYKSYPVGNTTYKIIDSIYTGTQLNKRAIQWYVKAYRGSVSSTSSPKTTNVPYESCPQ